MVLKDGLAYVRKSKDHTSCAERGFGRCHDGFAARKEGLDQAGVLREEVTKRRVGGGEAAMLLWASGLSKLVVKALRRKGARQTREDDDDGQEARSSRSSPPRLVLARRPPSHSTPSVRGSRSIRSQRRTSHPTSYGSTRTQGMLCSRSTRTKIDGMNVDLRFERLGERQRRKGTADVFDDLCEAGVLLCF